MIYQRGDRESFIELIILYLKYRNSYNFGLQPYKFWKNMIKYITGITHPRQLRSLFNSLIIRNFIHQTRNKSNSIRYIYNPKYLDMSYHDSIERTIDFNCRNNTVINNPERFLDLFVMNSKIIN